MNKAGPKYLTIHDNIKVDILSGKYPAGSFLPTETELMDTYDASRTTVRRAISILVSEGFINVRQGRGTEILPLEKHSKPTGFSKFHNATSITGRFLTDGQNEISVQAAVVDLSYADRDTANALGLDIGDSVYRLQRIQYIDNTPFSYMIDYLHPDRVPDLMKYGSKISNLNRFLAERYGFHPSSAEDTISASVAGFVESQVLNVAVGAPLLMFRRIYTCEAGPLQYSVTTCRSDIFTLVVTMGYDNANQFHPALEAPVSGGNL